MAATTTQPEVRSLSATSRLTDKHGRAITDLRVSVTDRCNYKCVYCRTGTEGAQYAELPIADYLRMVRVFVSLGIEKVRLTGGEPLLRHGLLEMISELSSMRTAFTPDGAPLSPGLGQPLDIALTTNGHLLEDLAQPLKDAGLNRITVSMDAIDHEKFARITRVPDSFNRVLAGVRAAKRVGLDPVKVNCVLLRGFNEDQIVEFAKFSRDEGVIVRFIEFMPLEEDRVWTPQVVVRLEEILTALNTFQPVVPLRRQHRQRDSTALHISRRPGRNRYHRARCRIHFADIAAAFASPPMANYAPACFRNPIMIYTESCGAAETMPTWLNLSAAPSTAKKLDTTSGSRIFSSPRAAWSTSAASIHFDSPAR